MPIISYFALPINGYLLIKQTLPDPEKGESYDIMELTVIHTSWDCTIHGARLSRSVLECTCPILRGFPALLAEFVADKNPIIELSAEPVRVIFSCKFVIGDRIVPTNYTLNILLSRSKSNELLSMQTKAEESRKRIDELLAENRALKATAGNSAPPKKQRITASSLYE